MIFIILFILLLIIIIVPVYVLNKDCKVSEWSEYTECDAKCDGGKQTRTRTIIRKALAGGSECPILKEEKKCNEQVCNIDCVVSNWPNYGVCSKSCEGGTQQRTRQIITPKKGTGKECPILEETQKCNEQDCDVDCIVSEWSAFSICDKECGDGTRKKTRQILRPKKGNGLACPVNLEEIEKCNLKECDVNCKLSEWSPWSGCDKFCGEGIDKRTREILTMNKGTGSPCPNLSELKETKTCNLKVCDVNCKLSEWTPWSKCNVTCGGGTQKQTRSIVVPKVGNGNACDTKVEQTQPCNEQACACAANEFTYKKLCYPKCSTGYINKDDKCIELCKPNYTDNNLTCKAPVLSGDRGIAYIRDNLSTNCIAGYTANNKYCVKTDYDYLKDVKDNKSIDRTQ